MDIAAVDLSVQHARAQEIDFIFPSFNYDRLDIIYKKGPDSTGHLFFFTKPLQPGIYLIYFAVTVGVLMLFFLVEHHCFPLHEPICAVAPAVCRQVAGIAWEFAGSVFRQGRHRFITYSYLQLSLMDRHGMWACDAEAE